MNIKLYITIFLLLSTLGFIKAGFLNDQSVIGFTRQSNDECGFSVAINNGASHNSYALVGCTGYQRDSIALAGTVSFLKREFGAWVFIENIFPDISYDSDQFGFDVAIDEGGNWAAIISIRRVYFYRRTSGTLHWNQIQVSDIP